MLNSEDKGKTFWEHLEDLRGNLIRIGLCLILFFAVSFILKDIIFKVVFYPTENDFITYSVLGVKPVKFNLISTEITAQMMAHIKTAFVFAIILSSPYIIKSLFSFIAPALYENEKKYSIHILISSYLLFLLGSLVNYFIIFPITLNFLADYKVATQVSTLISLESYTETLLMMTLVFGIIFEIPVLCWLLAKFGLLKYRLMKQYRRHAIVIILIAAAIITPTSDIFTLSIVFLPIWILYEASIIIVKHSEK
ncbi:MAG: twin-arginine translocase subunit TatC [Bacteroidales bacterium]|nr:twin-arginine translocase subunit TatC [Bacteroidales bacterium]